MRVFIPLLALTLLGATAPCGTAPASAGTYGYLGYGGPPPVESVVSDAREITVSQGLGDRMFTQIVATYERKTLTLLSLKRHASCCGSYWEATLLRNSDGTYAVEAQMTWPSPNGQDIYKESRAHMYVPPDAIINSGGFFFIPWIYAKKHASEVLELSFSPLRTDLFAITQTPAAPFPENVPVRDKALLLKPTAGGSAITLWYDPCTFTLDAYGSPDSVVHVRTGLL